MNYAQTLEYMFSALPMYHRIGNQAFKKGLDNIISLCEALGQPQNHFKTVHIAGTNGKGSTSHSIAAVLQSAGYKTGLYTSPHLKNFNERIRINGHAIDENNVISFISQHQALLDDIKPSFFEMTVAMAFWHFAQNNIDIGVIEVGLGGRLDSTNIIRPEISVITNISFDHMEMLGNTLPLIAAEKAGIIKMFVPVVVGEYQPEVAHVFQEKASEENAHLHFAEDSIAAQRKSNNAYGQIFDVTRNGQPYLQDLTYQLQGFYQQKNLVTVIAAVEQLQQRGWQISEQDIRRGLGHVIDLTGLKGRWQKIGNEPLVICDTGHNESGLQQVLEQIRAQKYEQLFMVIGVVREKDLAKFLQLLPQEAYYFFCQPSVPRGLPATELAEAAANAGLRGQVVEHPNDALKAALGMAKPQDFIFVGGSTFVVADIEAV